MTSLETRLQAVLARLVGQVRVGALCDPHGFDTALNASVSDAETLLRDLDTPEAAFRPEVPQPAAMVDVTRRRSRPDLRLVSARPEV